MKKTTSESSFSLETIKLAYELLLIRVPSIRNLRYIEQANLLNSEFEGINATAEDIATLDPVPTIEEEEIDLRLQMNHLFNI